MSTTRPDQTAERLTLGRRKVLLAAAAPREAAAALALAGEPAQAGREAAAADAGSQWRWRLAPINEHFDVVMTGVGKVNAAAGVLEALDPARHGAVLSIGVAGALPGSGLQVGQVVAATSSVYADEGVETDGGFLTLDDIGFPAGPFSGGVVPVDSGLLAWLAPVADACGSVATVSTCSGTDLRAAVVEQRTGAIAEAMEGAAIGHVLARRYPGLPFGELRAISNRTGRREAQGWNLELGLQRLSEALRRLDATFR